jgi:hypothetical protein
MGRLVALLILIAGCTEETKTVASTSAKSLSSYELFCSWSHREDAFLQALDDYNLGNRRAADAWGVVDSPSGPGKSTDEKVLCWEGALYYLGIFGSRSELPKLLQLATKDTVLNAETTHVSTLGGVTAVGGARAVAHRVVFLALGAQVRRQMMFDGALDPNGQAADDLIRDCALDTSKCMPDSPMHDYRRNRLQRNAVRALAIAGTTASTSVLQRIRDDLSSFHFLVRHAVGDADIFGRKIDANDSTIKQNVPTP